MSEYVRKVGKLSIEDNYLKNQVVEISKIWSKKDSFEIPRLKLLAKRVFDVFEKGGTLAFAGNGGSAAEANHLAAEFVGKCVLNHKALKSISLSTNTSVLTAIMNDYGADQVFSRQVEALLDSSSIFIGLSTSGKSPNILRGLKRAREIGAYTILWSGSALTEELEFVHEIWRVNSTYTPRIQEIHLVWGHLLAELVEVQIQQ